MRHGKKVNHLGRQAGHRKALLANMASSLLISEKKRIITTLAKAKALRTYIEPVITKSKTNTTHSRRMAFRYLRSKEAASILFGEVAEAVADRPGGYTRILKLGPRKGDNAEMALIELVDFNELLKDAPKKKSSRRRRGGSKKDTASTKKAAAPAKEVAKDIVEEVVEEPIVEASAEVKETAVEASTELEETAAEAEESTEESGSEEDKA